MQDFMIVSCCKTCAAIGWEGGGNPFEIEASHMFLFAHSLDSVPLSETPEGV